MNDNDFRKKSIKDLKERLNSGEHVGEYVKKKPWPKRYLNHGISNLYRYPIGGGHRLIFTVRTASGEYKQKTYQFLDFLNHTEYNRIFGYTN